MKSILIAITALAVISISSCYIGVEGRHRHHEASLQIHTDNVTGKDSLHTSAMTEINKKDSVQSPANPRTVK